MTQNDDIDIFYQELLNTHKQVCPEYTLFDIWNELNDECKKVKFEEIENDRMLLLIKMICFNISVDYSDEEWKCINEFDNYEVSNKGRVRRKDGMFNRFMHYDISKLGYKRVNLSKNNKSKKMLVHRLVADAFIPNPDNLPVVNHKDENPWNNTVENLEWCTYKYNNEYNKLMERRFETRSKNIKTGKVKLGTPVVQLTLNGQFVKEWVNAQQAFEKTGINSSSILSCCKNKPRYKTAGGYKWMYKNDYNKGGN